ncbi:MAG: hypothetical protein Q8K98_12640 [Bacteroidota bacterium]|nr:hypothetical protein [Bacteroidota bacterium]
MGGSKNPKEYRISNPPAGRAGKELFTPLDSRRWSELKNKNNIQRGKF